MTSVSGLSSVSSMFNPSQVASRMMSAGDSDKSGSLSFSEFSSISKGAASEGTQTSKTDQMQSLFDAIDSNADGSLTESELTEFGQKLSSAMASMLQAQEQSSGATQGSTGSSGSYDPQDTNKDGTVSLMERLAAVAGTQQANASANQSDLMTATSSYQSSTASSTNTASISILT